MRLVLAIFGLLATLMGILIVLPDKNHKLRPVQIGLNELSWIPGTLGLIAMIGGFLSSPRAWLTVITGGIGAALAARPFLEYSGVTEDMTSAMLTGLGRDYESEIPPAVRARLADSTWSLENSLGERERSSQGRLLRDVPYTERISGTLKLDVYQPLVKPAVGDQYPAIIVIHGGGWRHSDKGEGYFRSHHRYYANAGYVVFDIQYRLSGVARWPAQHEDVQDAIRWVKERAGEYDVDTTRIVLLGRSAGAHLALMAGYCAGADTSVTAIICLYAPVELRLPDLTSESAIFGLFDGSYEDKPADYESATPLNFVRDGLPPTLIIEGGMDTITPYFHGDKLANALSYTDTPFVLLRVPWSRHGFDAVPSGLSRQLTQYHLDRFLAWTLYREY